MWRRELGCELAEGHWLLLVCSQVGLGLLTEMSINKFEMCSIWSSNLYPAD